MMTFLPLRFVLPLMILAFSVVVGSANYMLQSSLARDLTIRNASDEIRADASRLQARIERRVSADRGERLADILDAFAGDQSLRLAMIVDAEHRILASLEGGQTGVDLASASEEAPPPLREWLNAPRNDPPAVSAIGDFLGSALAVRVPPGNDTADRATTGWLLLGYDLQARLQRAEAQVATQSVVFVAMLAALAGMIALLIHFGFSRRVTRILQGVRRFVAGATDARIELTGRDELARIARALNDGAAEILASERRLRNSEARLSAAQRIARLGHWEIRVEQRVIRGSAEQMQLLGLDPNRRTMPLDEFLALVHPDDRPAITDLLDATAAGTLCPIQADYRIIRPDGRVPRMQSRWRTEHDDGGVRLLGTIQDVTEQQRIREALEETRERALVTLHSIGDGVITTDAEGAIEYLNPAAGTLTGWQTEAAVGHPLRDVFDPLDEPGTETDVTAGTNSGQVVLRNRSGERLTVEHTASPIVARNGALLGRVLVFHDVTETRQLTRELEWQARHDALTGLANRNEFEHRLREALAAARANSTHHALIYFDLDQFKIVNDTCGHAAGDELLRQLPVVLRPVIRDTDVFARLGGDEFAFILHTCDLDGARLVAEKLLAIIREFRFVWGKHTFEVGASIGVVAVSAESRDIGQLLTAADLACYSAKDHGRGRIHVYQPEDQELARRHGELHQVATISRALEENRFVLYTQPIVPCALDTTTEMSELLIRMIDEEGRIVPPGAFIPAAERYDLMPAVDRWVIRHLFEVHGERLREAARDGSQIYSINLSGTSLSDERFRQFVLDEIARCEIPAETLCFEITETAAIANLSRTRDFIVELQRLGCHFALDDFGAGVSSFAYLKNLPVDYLKIDGSFVRDLLDDPIDGALVQAINYVGHQLGIRTIAEFVENESLFELLQAMGIDYAQGFGIAEPAPFADEPLHSPRRSAGDSPV